MHQFFCHENGLGEWLKVVQSTKHNTYNEIHSFMHIVIIYSDDDDAYLVN